jgi:hypothetical protein
VSAERSNSQTPAVICDQSALFQPGYRHRRLGDAGRHLDHTKAPTVMIAEKGAAMIEEEAGNETR